MASEYMFAVGTIGKSTRSGRKPSTLQGAANHNRRAIQTEMGARGHIDPQRTASNETIHGPATASGVVALAMSMMAGAGIDVASLRKDYTQAIELLFSLPADAAVDDGQFFRRCVEWTGERLGLDNVLSADIHRDESAPHCHVLVSPLVNGRMQGSSLIDRPATAALRESFYRDVAQPFGLKKPVNRMKGASRAGAVRAVLAALESRQDAILRSALWAVVKREIERNPAPYVESLGIELQSEMQKPMRTVAQIFTSPGKGPKSERTHKHASIAPATKPIGFETGEKKPIGFENGHEKDRNLSCVGFDIPTQPLSAQAAMPEPPQSTHDSSAMYIDADGVTNPSVTGEAVVQSHERLQVAKSSQEVAAPQNTMLKRSRPATQEPAPTKQITKASLYVQSDTPESIAETIAYLRKYPNRPGTREYIKELECKLS